MYIDPRRSNAMCADHEEFKPRPGESHSQMHERLAEEARQWERYEADAAASEYEAGPMVAPPSSPDPRRARRWSHQKYPAMLTKHMRG